MIRMRCNAFITCLAGAVLAIGLMTSHQAQAQIGMTNANPRPMIGGSRQPAAPAPSPAPALPGAQSNPDSVAKATNTDLAPTDSLFDAVNRGDIATARDAIGRGADLNAHNVLGLTPLDLSVDLGRNDITFLLLSLRGSAPPPATAPTTASAAPAAKSAGKMPATVAARSSAPATPRRETRVASVATAEPSPTVRTDPGTPAPQAGFLGFSGH
jgi:ankyrin repeat protein